MSVRTRILERIRTALADRPVLQLPDVPEPAEVAWEEAYQNFALRLERAGAEVVRFGSPQEARGWLSEFAKPFDRAWVSPRVPERLRPDLPEAEPEVAELGVSYAIAAVAETGSVVLASREGRRGQLLVPTQLVWVEAGVLYPTLLAALRAVRGEGVAALGLHSGPSKSADIGQIMVKGVHGPGRLVVGVLAFPARRLDWGRVERLAGKRLLTKSGKPFTVVRVTEKSVSVRPEGSGNTYTIARSNLERAARFVAEGGELKGPTDYKAHIADQGPAYAWVILKEIGVLG